MTKAALAIDWDCWLSVIFFCVTRAAHNARIHLNIVKIPEYLKSDFGVDLKGEEHPNNFFLDFQVCESS